MNFSIKPIEIEHKGWKIFLKRIRRNTFFEHRNKLVSFKKENYNENGGLDVGTLTNDQIKALEECSFSFLKENFIDAKCTFDEEQVLENEEMKDYLIECIADDIDFQDFYKGYINGEKKT